ncbi:MAG: YfiR family protein [Burkholderiales bacterium]
MISSPLQRLALLFGLLIGVCAANAQTPEDKLKAAFVYNFVKFVTWPGGAFASQAHITICVAGKGGGIEEALAPLATRTAHGKTIVLRKAAGESTLQGCEVAYIAPSERARMSVILQELAGQSVLTVSDADNFAQAGGMIGLVSEGNKVVFEVNLGEIEKAGLKVNAQLLKVAKTVRKGKT